MGGLYLEGAGFAAIRLKIQMKENIIIKITGFNVEK